MEAEQVQKAAETARSEVRTDDVTAPEGRSLIADRDWKVERHSWLEGIRRDPDLNAMTKVVAHAMALGRLANRDVARCHATKPELASACGTSVDSVKRALKELENASLIVKRSGAGRGKSNVYGFLIRARIVPLKGGVGAPSKGGAGAPFSGSEKGAQMPPPRCTGAPFSPYIGDYPDLSHNARAADAVRNGTPSDNPMVRSEAEAAVRSLRSGRLSALDGLKPWVLNHILAADLLTAEERQAAGLAEKGDRP
ncbi:hypothetical protein ATO6_15425 [Oceanicola sp. 22II-s10i]|nr:hypothetical protein ATO6_15425 [Oceanicola sp. 22II-s10i]